MRSDNDSRNAYLLGARQLEREVVECVEASVQLAVASRRFRDKGLAEASVRMAKLAAKLQAQLDERTKGTRNVGR